ncbi:unnamed protein product, partial [Oikopleura dioica]
RKRFVLTLVVDKCANDKALRNRGS